MNTVRSIFDLGYVRMDGVWFEQDHSTYPGEIQGRAPDVVEYWSREGFSILFHEGRVYLKKADPSDLEALKIANVVPQDLEARSLGDTPHWIPSSYVHYVSDIFDRFTEATEQQSAIETRR